MKVSYKTQIENEGWTIPVEDGKTSGNVGKWLRMEALIINLLEKNGLDIRIEAQSHVQNQGWLPKDRAQLPAASYARKKLCVSWVVQAIYIVDSVF